MRRVFIGCAVLVAAVITLSHPVSAMPYSWIFDDGLGLTGTGSLTTGAPDNGGFDITSFDGTIGGKTVSILGGDPGNASISPLGVFSYDNILYLSADPLFDVNGLLISIDGREGNIWGNGVPGSYSYWTNNGSGYDYSNNSVSFNLFAATGGGSSDASVPEPSTLLILAVGFLGIRQLGRRKWCS